MYIYIYITYCRYVYSIFEEYPSGPLLPQENSECMAKAEDSQLQMQIVQAGILGEAAKLHTESQRWG